MAESELDRAAREYASQASPFAGLQDFLLNRPVFDRGPAPTPTAPTLRTLDFADDAAQNQARQYREMLAEQKAQQDALLESRFAALIAQQQASEQGITSAREAALANLRDTLQQETASAAAAQAAARSEVVKALEDRLAGVKESIATESEALREQGLQERADIRAQQQAVVDQYNKISIRRRRSWPLRNNRLLKLKRLLSVIWKIVSLR